MVIAPHPDDETFGCGGTMALMRAAGVPVSVIFLSRGEASHVDCCETPMAKVGAIRERSAERALSLLGLEVKDIYWLGLADRGFVRKGQEGFDRVVRSLRELIVGLAPGMVISPYYLDVLPDHEACAEMVREAMEGQESCEQMFYPVWMWHRLRMKTLPIVLRDKVFKMDISEVIEKKIAAMDVYFNEVNPGCGYPWCGRLPTEFHRYFSYPYEIFIKRR